MGITGSLLAQDKAVRLGRISDAKSIACATPQSANLKKNNVNNVNYDLRLYKQLFDSDKASLAKNSGGRIRFDAILIDADRDGNGYHRTALMLGPLVIYTTIPEAANDG